MYLSDLIRDVVNEKVANTFVGKNITIEDFDQGLVTFDCAKAEFSDDDGYCCLHFEDNEGNEYTTDGQGLDIWYKINYYESIPT